MDVTLITRQAPGASPQDPRIYDSTAMPAAAGALRQLRATIADADLAAPPIVLPDFHHKRNMELPSSVAVATRGSVRPTLTSGAFRVYAYEKVLLQFCCNCEHPRVLLQFRAA